ncbi:hypothetical protein niasHT_023029 [Heterodera trifolii]|uniref:G-protein coupled receptors family 1 profile domain-containing protein n=1 Tax=Heterodera trifolii TaxID=157864 RepID=A0ABD2JWU3_9BILA
MVPLIATESLKNQQLTYIELFHQNGDQHTLAMWLIMGGKCALSSVGILFNAILAATTVKSKKVHNTCNVLFAFDSLFLTLFQLNPLITWLIAVFGTNFVPNSTCFYFQAVPVFSLLMSFCLMFQIGLERLANVLFPICMVMCTASDISGRGLFYTISFNRSMIMHILLIIIYIAIVLALKFKNENQHFSKSIFRSLLFLVFLETIGWLPSIYLAQFLKIVQFSSITTIYITTGFGTIPTSVTSSANGPTLYYFSSLYREEINAFLVSIGIKKPIGTQHQQHANAIALNVVT